MRILLTTILCCIFSLTISAQTFNINGTLSLSNGDPATFEYIEIYGENLAGNVFVNTSTFSDANGLYSKDIDISGADSQNAIEVKMRDCDSTFITQTVFVFPGATDATADFTYCNNQLNCEVVVEIIDQAGSPLPYLVAENLAGEAPFTYQWSTGELTGGIFPTDSGNYCVTMTDATGCEALNCATVELNPPLDSCDVYITEIANPNGVTTLQANWSSNEMPTFQWSTNQSGPNINVTVAGNYCVTATYSGGCEVDACIFYDGNNGGGQDTLCQVNVTAFATASGTLIEVVSQNGIAPFAYQWSTGQVGNQILTNDAGTYCITMTDADGCEAEDCVLVSVNTCFVNISESTNPNGVSVLEANWPSNDVPIIEWSTGQTSSNINVFDDGTYCVTAIFPNSCVATSCYDYFSNPIDSTCNVFLSEEIGSGGIEWIVANVNGAAPFTYQWSGGETSASVLSEPGVDFCVTITDANGCESDDCLFVQSNNSIQGLITSDSIAGPNSGMVYLIQFDPVDSTLTAVDSIFFGGAIGEGYGFFNVPAGEYLVKAALVESSPGYSTTLPTYYVDNLFWHEATSITIPYGGPIQAFNIDMVLGNNPGGPGFIGGFVTEGANRPTNNTSALLSPGDPIPNVSILLLDENDNPVTHTVTNQAGRYEFDDLPYGTYQVFVEIIGKEQGMQMVTIGPNNPQVNNIDFNVNSTFTTVSTAEINEVKSISLFPNPMGQIDILNVQLELTDFEDLTIEVVSVNGNTLFSIQENVTLGVNSIQLDMNNLNTGVYFLNIKSSNGVLTRKFIR